MYSAEERNTRRQKNKEGSSARRKGRRGRKGQVAKEYIVERRDKYKGKIYRK
jgi:hypothetical protein